MAKSRAASWLLLLFICFTVLIPISMGNEYDSEEGEGGSEREGERKGKGKDLFLLEKMKRVVRTDAGEMRVIGGPTGWGFDRPPMHIGFISMEPKSIFTPHYLDSSLVLFVRRGQAKIGLIYKDTLVEKPLKTGDLYRVPAGSAFYLVNTGEGQRLHLVCSIDTSESLGFGHFQSFFIGGGTNPPSVLAGFDPQTLAIAFNVSVTEIKELLSRENEGQIVFTDGMGRPSVWTKFVKLKHHEKEEYLKTVVQLEEDETDDDEKREMKEEERKSSSAWKWARKFLSILGAENSINKQPTKRRREGPDAYNLYESRPSFRNDYGWSLALHKEDYKPLKQSGIGVYLVNLTAGAMMAPHMNPTAIEYGVVLSGSGYVQIVFPNGSQAMNARVGEGDVFWVPRYFPFCQIASETGPFEFFGFTTSARKNKPQFFAGARSVLHTLRGPEIASAFGVSEERFGLLVDAQREAVILPPPRADVRTTL